MKLLKVNFCQFHSYKLWQRPFNWHKNAPAISSYSCRYLSAAKGVYQKHGTGDLSNARLNQVNIQMLFDNLHQQIFKNAERPKVSEKTFSDIVQHLKQHNLWEKGSSLMNNVEFELPELKGDIDRHFRNISEELNKPYSELADQLCISDIPPSPKTWSTAVGWTKYDHETGCSEQVPFPQCRNIIFDVEVLMAEGQFPTMATAVSPDAWYSWVSPRVFRNNPKNSEMHLDDLIPLETQQGEHTPPGGENWTPRLTIGHNVGFDRSFIKEQYYIKGSQMKFLDTMSLHISISGLTNTQRILYKAHQKGESGASRKEIRDMMQSGFVPSFQWTDESTLNNLADVFKLYCPDKPPLQKETRSVFVEGNMQDVRDQFQTLMSYCSSDVCATHSVFQKLWTQYLIRFPHPVTLGGMLEMGTTYLPINSAWQKYKDSADKVYTEKEIDLRDNLVQLANEARDMENMEKYKDDLWLWDIEWKHVNTLKPLLKEDVEKERLHAEAIEKESNKSTDDKDISDYYYPDEKSLIKLSGEEYVKDDVPYDEDWPDLRAMEKKYKKVKEKKIKKKVPRLKFSYPKWFADLCPRPAEVSDKVPMGPSKISTLRRVTPKLLKLTWENYPLHYDQTYGWGYLKPNESLITGANEEIMIQLKEQEKMYKENESDNPDGVSFPLSQFLEYCKNIPQYKEIKQHTDQKQVLITQITDLEEEIQQSLDQDTKIKLMRLLRNKEKALKQLKFNEKKLGKQKDDGSYDIGVDGVKFVPLPHKDGPKNRVGNPLSKSFLPFIESGTLSSQLGDHINNILQTTIMCSYWKNNMKRVHEQIAIRLPEESLEDCVTSSELYQKENYVGCILPRVVASGTITRRAVEKTWLTASNAYPDRIGSELKAMIQSPPGYHFVGADVDSQELWIAAVLGDSHFGCIHGCTALGWMTLQGNKLDGTDLHSKTAQLVGISRDQAKIFNYGRIYGAGKTFAKRLLMQFNHKMTEAEATKKAKNMYEATKGKQQKWNSDVIISYDNYEDEDDDKREKSQMSGRWYGGSESAMFNKLETIAESLNPMTPALSGRISKALEPKKVKSDFMTSRVNWVVQSSAVDYLHLMLVCMKWLLTKYDIDGRFSISIHDEVRYLVSVEDQYRAALALQIANLLTRCMFAYKLGMNDLPQSVAFFSAVDIDRCMRKEAHLDCKTPSNPHGVMEGYGIPPGEALSVYDIVKRTGGCISKSDQREIEKQQLST